MKQQKPIFTRSEEVTLNDKTVLIITISNYEKPLNEVGEPLFADCKITYKKNGHLRYIQYYPKQLAEIEVESELKIIIEDIDKYKFATAPI
jgi:hypothetical protein